MIKMKKEYDPNKVKRRKRKPVVYIICEGRETEVSYFKHFKNRNCLVDIVPMSSKFTAAEYLVKNVENLLRHTDFFRQDGDQIWCVFDRDDNSKEELRKAKAYADKKGYRIVYSNPSFEYWYLVHFLKHNGYLRDADAVITQLKKKDRLEKYEKTKDVFGILLPYQANAIQRAKERVFQLKKDDIEVIGRDSNPVTTAYELVEYLQAQQTQGAHNSLIPAYT